MHPTQHIATDPPCRIIDKPKSTKRAVKSNLRELHDSLSAELDGQCEEISRNPELRKVFLDKLDGLISQLGGFAKEVCSRDEFEWLSKVTAKWQIVLLSILRQPRDLRKEIGMPDPSPEYCFQLSEATVSRYLQGKAYQIGQERKLNEIYNQYIQLQRNRGRIHKEITSTSEQEKKDWYLATVCFATEVLDGRISFPHQISQDLYPLLENVWLEDVKRMKAYLIWEENDCPFDYGDGRHEYFQACRQLRNRILDHKAKASGPGFLKLRNYLEQMYLSDQAKLRITESSVINMISRKAHKIWELRNHNSFADADWETAGHYVRDFYENIIPAATKQHARHVAAVENAFCAVHRGTSSQDIANAFEAALVIHYLPADSRSIR